MTGAVVWLDSLRADLRYAVRALRASPGFAVVAILSLALGIGANAAIFTLINAVMLRTLPVSRPEELVVLSRDERLLTHAMFEAIRERQTVFADMFAYASTRVDLSTGGEAHPVPAGFVSGSYFATLGVRPPIGRAIATTDDAASCQSVAVVSHAFWQSELGGTPDVVGRSLSLDGHPFQVVGVMGPSFFGVEIGYHVPIWIPLCTEAVFYGAAESGSLSRMGRIVIGRTKPNVTLAQVRAHLAALRPAVLDATVQYSAPKQGILMDAAEYRKTTFDAKAFANGDPALRLTYGDALFALMAVVGVVLLIACANVANLLLARAAARQREVAIRLAIGASRARLVRQLLTESILLSSLGAAAGALFAAWGSRALVAFLSSPQQPIALDLEPDARVIVFTIAVAVVTGILFGLAPAWRAGRVDPQSTMRPRSRGVIEGHSRFAAGKALVVGQIALSLVAVTAAGLLLGTWRRLATVDPGYDRDHVLLISASASAAPIPARQRADTYGRIVERLRAIPGVVGAGAAAYTPLVSSWNTVINVGAGASATSAIVRKNEVSEGYLAAIGTRLLAGRDFGRGDTPTSTPVAIVSERLAREYLGGEQAIGQLVRFGSPPNDPVEIVGIMADSRQESLGRASEPMVYTPLSQDTVAESSIGFALRTRGSADAIMPAAKAAFLEFDPRISFSMTTLERRLSSSIRLPRTLGALAGFFGALAVLLAAIGLYGTMAYNVARRRGEIAVRVALGAAGDRIIRLVLGDVGRIVVAGIAIGVVLSLATTRLVASLLYGVEPNDVPTLAGAALLLSVVAVVAAAFPARRAARVDPMTALRED